MRIKFYDYRMLKLSLFSFLIYMIGAHGETGAVQLQLSGTIIDAGCDVSASASQSIELGRFDAGTFSSIGTVTPKEFFGISLKDCSENISGTSVSFSGVSDINDNTLLALTDSGTQAQGIGVQLVDDNDDPVAINTTTKLYPLNAGDNLLQFGLRYKSTIAKVSAGDANAVLYFDMNYQ